MKDSPATGAPMAGAQNRGKVFICDTLKCKFHVCRRASVKLLFCVLTH